MRGETFRLRLAVYDIRFQSTPLIRGETLATSLSIRIVCDFNPLPSYEGRHGRGGGRGASPRISIHSPHTRGDEFCIGAGRESHKFQSTPLTRGETGDFSGYVTLYRISIHSPHTRGDLIMGGNMYIALYISIHSPHTRGDADYPALTTDDLISIHSPHTRGDAKHGKQALQAIDFNPLPSHEGRHTHVINSYHPTINFNPLPSHEGRRCCRRAGCQFARISIRSPHTRGDSISLQKSIRIYVSLHNKTMIHRFSGLYKPLFAAQSPIFGVRNPRKSHDSFTFARFSEGSGITP